MLNPTERTSGLSKSSVLKRTRLGELTAKQETVSYQFRLQNRSRLSSRLEFSAGRGNFSLWTENNQLIKASKSSGTETEKIRSLLEPGVYKLQVSNKGGSAEFKLQMFAETSPTLEMGSTERKASLFPSAPNADIPTPIQLTNDAQAEFNLKVSGSNLAWVGYDGSRRDIFAFIDFETRRVTDTDNIEWEFDFSGSNIAWAAYDQGLVAGDQEIYLYDGNQIKTLTNNSNDDFGPVVSGYNVAWRDVSYDRPPEIFLYSNGTTKQLTDNSYYDGYPVISGSNVAWDIPNGIMLYDGQTTREITNGIGGVPKLIHGSTVIWQNGSTVYSYDGTQSRQLVDVGANSRELEYSNSSVSWRDGNKLFFYDGTTTHELDETTESRINDPFNAHVVGSNIVWEKYNGNGYDIYFFDGKSTRKLTDEGVNRYAQLSGSKVYWIKNSEIFYIDLRKQGSSGLGGSLFSSGLNNYLNKLSNTFSNQVLKNELPLFGQKLISSPASQFISQVKNRIQFTFQDIDSFSNESIQQALFNALGTGRNRVLGDINNDGVVDLADVQFTEPASGRVEFQINLVQSKSFSSTLAKDLGLPGLKLDLGGNASVQSNFGLNLKFGYEINGSDPNNFGFYANTSDVNELSFSINASEVKPNSGKLGFLPIKASDAQTFLKGDFAIDIKDSSDTDSTLSVSELNNLGNALIQTRLTGRSEIKLSLATNLGSLPSLLTDLRVNWGLNTANVVPGQSIGLMPTVAFNDTRLDMGTFMGNLLSPIFQKIQGITSPLSSVTDNLTKPIPFLKSLLKKNISLLDLAETLSKTSPDNKFNISYIRAAAEIIKVAGNLPTGNNVFLNLGSLNLGNVDVRSSDFKLASIDPKGKITSTLRYEGRNALDLQNFLQPLQKGSTAVGKFELPILSDPSEAFKLLLGRTDVELFRYAMPTLSAQVKGGQTIPILGPLGIRLQGTVGASINLKFGLDASGLKQFSVSNNPNAIFEYGFYLDSRTIPLSVFAGVNVGPAIDIILARIFVSGGILGTVEFRWSDDNNPNDPYKVRLREISSNLGTLDIFDLSGRIDAKLDAEAFVVGLGSYDQNFGTFNILTFNGPAPTFSSQSKGYIPLLADILELAKPIRDAISRLGVGAARAIFGANNGQAVVDGLSKFDENVLQKAGITSLMGPSPLGGLNLLITHGPDVVKAFQNADVQRELKRLASYATKDARAAAAIASSIVTKTTKYINDAKAATNRIGAALNNAGEKIESFVRSVF